MKITGSKKKNIALIISSVFLLLACEKLLSEYGEHEIPWED